MTEKLLGNLKQGRLFILSAPAGTGKTSLVNRLTEEFSCVSVSVSYTTREMRPGEVPGVHYHFIDQDEFDKMVSQGEFLEHVSLYHHSYGTSSKAVQEQLENGKHVVLVIDTQGALLLKGKVPAVYIFIKPPDFDALRQRLKKRKTESEGMIEERLEWARKELEASKFYDYCIVNDEFEIAYQVLRSVLIAEEHRVICC